MIGEVHGNKFQNLAVNKKFSQRILSTAVRQKREKKGPLDKIKLMDPLTTRPSIKTAIRATGPITNGVTQPMTIMLTEASDGLSPRPFTG